MRIGRAARLILLVGAAFLPRPAWSQPAISSTELSPDEMAALKGIAKVVVECRKDGRPYYCAELNGLVAHLAATGGEAPPIIETDTPRAPDAAASGPPGKEAKGLRFADGHAPISSGQVPPPGGADVTLAASSDTKTASIALNVDLTASSQGNPRTLTITAQAPIGQDQDYTNIATQDGMTKASSIGLAYSHLFVKETDRSAVINSPAYQARCRALLDRFTHLSPDTKIDPPFKPGGCSADLVTGLVTAANLPAAAGKPLLKALEDLRKTADPTVDSVWMTTSNAKVGYEKHAFYDASTLDKVTRDRTPFEIGLAATRVFHGGDMSGTLSYKFQRTYKDGGEDEETKTLCHPVGAPFLPCVSGFIGLPLRAEKHLISADYRYISEMFRIPFGVNPGATYDAQSGEYSFQLPVYVVANKAKGLTGGVRYDWTSEKHKSVVGIFVTSAFCVLPGYAGCTPAEDSK